jgi:Uma2 family endonuclease
MIAHQQTYITGAAYLAAERQAVDKSEYFQGEIYIMAGASRNHNRITENLSIEIGGFLKNKTCQSYSSDLRIHVPRNSLYTYPDLIISCEEEQYLDSELDTLLNPTALIEVLSKSTGKYDQEGKFELYREIDSLQEYITVHSQQMKASVWQKSTDGFWTLAQEISQPTDLLHIRTIGLTFPLADLYQRVDFQKVRK